MTNATSNIIWAVQVQLPSKDSDKPGRRELQFVSASDESKVNYWAKIQYGMLAQVTWCAKVGE